jgi:membrane fusion protein (multidrug efflux system)
MIAYKHLSLVQWIQYSTGVIGIMAVVIGCEGKGASVKSAVPVTKAPIVDVMVAEPRAIDNTVEANGTIVANEYVELHPEISGRITWLHVPEGSNVQKGELIARIYDADLQAQLEKSKVLLDMYQKTEERDRQLLAINGINQSDYDLALNNVNSTKADIDYTQAQINKTIIRAPFAGVVGLRQVSIGAYVSPASVIATLQQLDKTKVDFTLPEQYAPLIKKGATVTVETDGPDSSMQKAMIIATEPQINLSSRNIKVRAVLEKGYEKPGAFVKVLIRASTAVKSILVPTNAIIPDDKNNQLVIVKNGKANYVNVQTGLRMANNVAITEGLNAGDTVVVTGVLFARPSAPVKIRSIKTAGDLSMQ